MSLSDSCVRSVDETVADVDRLLRRTALTGIGAFRCPPSHPRFADSGPIRNHCFVFPRTASRIEHDRGDHFLADPTLVSLYNVGQVYRRAAVSPEGDHCDYFVVAPSMVREALRARRLPAAEGDEGRLFRQAFVRCESRLYARQRQVFHAARAGQLDDLALESAVVELLDAVLDQRAPLPRPLRGTPRARRQVEEVRRLLAIGYTRPLSLAALATHVDASPYHLSRTFQAATGLSVHQYRIQLRMRAALDRLPATRDLTALALSLGFSSHSHFSATFRRVFGVAPSGLR